MPGIKEESVHGKYTPVYQEAFPLLQTRYNVLHTNVCFGFAQQLLAREGGREEVVLPAILLHDVGWIKLTREQQEKAFGPDSRDAALNRIHELEGARMAGEILDRLGYDRAQRDLIVEIIEGHDSRAKALSHEDALVKDADKLWRFAPDGFRLILEWFPRDALEFADWLEPKIRQWFHTATAQEIARQELARRRREWTPA